VGFRIYGFFRRILRGIDVDSAVMSKRKPIANTVETEILTKSGRRCCFCFGLHGDLALKQGQIAHIDHDSSNSAEGNLAFLCLEHHDQYDGRTSQSKGLIDSELRIYKRLLVQAIERREHEEHRRKMVDRSSSDLAKHDASIFSKSDRILKESLLLEICELLGSDHSYLSEARIQMTAYCRFFAEAGNQYLLEELQKHNAEVVSGIRSMLGFMTQHFFYYPDKQGKNPQFCMYPDLNIDRNGDGRPESGARYNQRTQELNGLIDQVEDSYRRYRLVVKRMLLV
jgi:hypothetical protein